jgi:transposase-like protein
MGQILHKCAKTTHVIRKEIQESKESIAKLAKKYNLNPKTIIKWRKRKDESVEDSPMGRKESQSILTEQEEAIICEFRRITRLSIDDCFISLKGKIPNLELGNLYRCLKRNGLNVLPQLEEATCEKKKFKHYPIGYLHIDITTFYIQKTKYYLFVAIDRTSKLAYVDLYEEQTIENSIKFLKAVIAFFPYKINCILTDNGSQFTYELLLENLRPKDRLHKFDEVCQENNIEHRLTKFRHPWTNGQVERFNGTIKEATTKKYYYDSPEQFKKHLQDYLLVYNYAKKLKALKFMTPYEKIISEYEKDPSVFNKNPYHDLKELNN